jgi:membrane-bound lytic murein transglycosylase D
VQDREKFYATRAAYMQRMVARGSRYLFHVVEEIQKRHMPTELALLPFVESAFNPEAMSTAKASGMWQFVPATGRDYALKQNIFRDDRRDVLASTRAALDHLNRLYGLFGDWHLVLAAYNCGEGNVQRAIAKNKAAGKPTDYANLPLPAETRLYVPKLQAVKNIVSRPDQFAIELLPLKNHPYFLSVPITRDVDVDLAARFAGVSVEEFRQLNPQMNKPVILAAGTEQILLPYDNANAFAERWHDHRGPYARWTAWVSPRTLRAAEAAKLVGMPEAQLREVNRIPPRMLVKAGSTLLVPRTSARAADVPEALAENASMSLAPDVPPLRQVTLKAGRKGDSVAAVAKRYRVSPAQVAQWNKVAPAARFKPGASIVVWVQPSKPRVNGNKNKPGERAVKPAKPVRVALQ